MDLLRLRAPVRPDDPTEDPDFISHMRAALHRPPEPLVVGAPPTYHDMEQAVKKGSPATSLDELPRPLVSALPGFCLRVLVGVVEALASRTSSWLLSAVLHFFLAKKLLVWWCATASPSCWCPTSGGWRRSLCRITGSPAESFGAPSPRSVCLSAAIVWPDASLGVPLAASRLGHPARGSLVRRLG